MRWRIPALSKLVVAGIRYGYPKKAVGELWRVKVNGYGLSKEELVACYKAEMLR